MRERERDRDKSMSTCERERERDDDDDDDDDAEITCERQVKVDENCRASLRDSLLKKMKCTQHNGVGAL